jgi:hypothetical protein
MWIQAIACVKNSLEGIRRIQRIINTATAVECAGERCAGRGQGGIF